MKKPLLFVYLLVSLLPIDSRTAAQTREIDPDELVGHRTLSEHLADVLIPRSFRELYTGARAPSDDEATDALMDSLTVSTDSRRHPFYFAVFTRRILGSDGALGEASGVYAREYVETRPQRFLDYFTSESWTAPADFREWAYAVLLELSIAEDGEPGIKVEKLCERMKRNCPEATPRQVRMIDDFARIMKEIDMEIIEKGSRLVK